MANKPESLEPKITLILAVRNLEQEAVAGSASKRTYDHRRNAINSTAILYLAARNTTDKLTST